MSDTPSKKVDELLLDWELADRKPTPEELCRDCPDLIEEIRREIALIRRHDRFDAAQCLAVEDTKPAVPANIGEYKIVALIGEGGMGTVYRALEPETGRVVAIKLVREDRATRETLHRFGRERDLHGKLEHENIVRVYTWNILHESLGPVPYLVMEFVDGRRLDDFVRHARPSLRARVELLRTLCAAVGYAHRKEVIHRDLKPSNILVTAAGQPKILDFGVARAAGPRRVQTTLHTEPGRRIGTMQYASPEQADGREDDLDCSSDVFSLGIIAYEILSGRPARDFTSKGEAEVLRVIRDEDPTSLGRIDRSLRGDLETIVQRAMDKNPKRRFTNAGEMAEEFDRVLASMPIRSRKPTVLYRTGKYARRHKTAVAVMAALAIGLIIAVSLLAETTRQRRRADDTAHTARLQVADQLGRRGIALADEGDPAMGLLFLARALQLEEFERPDSQRIREARIRLSTTLAMTPQPLVGHPAVQSPTWENGGLAFDPLITRTEGTDHDGSFGTARILDPAAGVDVTLRHRPGIYDVQISPDGRWLASSGRDRNVRLYELPSGRVVREAKYDAGVWSIAFSPDSTRMIFCDWGGMVTSWSTNGATDAWSYRVLKEFTLVHASFSSDGRSVALSGDKGLASVLNTDTGEPILLRVEVPRRALCSALNADGSEIAVGCIDGSVHRFDVATGLQIGPMIRHSNPIGRMVYSGDHIVVATCIGTGYRPWMKSGPAHVWPQVANSHVRWSHRRTVIGERGGGGMAMAGGDVIACDGDGIKRIDVETGTVKAFFALPAAIENYDATIAPSGRAIFFQLSPAVFAMVDLNDGSTLMQPILGGWPILSTGIDARGERIAIVRRRSERGMSPIETLESWDVASGQRLFDPVVLGETENRLQISPEGELVATGDASGASYLWDARTGARVRTLPSHTQRAWSPVFSRDGSWVLSASFAGTAFATSLRPEVPSPTIPMRHADNLQDINTSPDCRLLATAGADCIVRLWHLPSGLPAAPPLVHPRQPRTPIFSADSKIFAAGCPGNGCKLWSTLGGDPLSPFFKPGSDDMPMRFVDGDAVIIGGDASITRIDFRPDHRPLQELTTLAQALSHHRLDADNNPTTVRSK